jgi:hypothetical protein
MQLLILLLMLILLITLRRTPIAFRSYRRSPRRPPEIKARLWAQPPLSHVTHFDAFLVRFLFATASWRMYSICLFTLRNSSAARLAIGLSRQRQNPQKRGTKIAGCPPRRMAIIESPSQRDDLPFHVFASRIACRSGRICAIRAQLSSNRAELALLLNQFRHQTRPTRLM